MIDWEKFQDKNNLVCLNSDELSRVALKTKVVLNKKAATFKRIFFDTPKGDFSKKGYLFFEDHCGNRKTLTLCRANEEVILNGFPEELMNEAFPFLEISGKKRSGRVGSYGGASLTLNHLTNLKCKNLFTKNELKARKFYELRGITPADLGFNEKSFCLNDKLRAANLFAELEIPYNHDLGETALSLSQEDDSKTALKKLIKRELVKIKGYRPVVSQDLHPEFLHEMRVAVRRLRSYLRVFGTVFGGKRSLSLSLTASSYGIDLGAVRDFDVFIEKLNDWLPEVNAGMDLRKTVIGKFSDKRNEAFEILQRVLSSKRFAGFLSRIENLVGENSRDNVYSREPFTGLASKKLGIYKNEVKKRAGKYSSSKDPIDLHRTRIAFKRLRYLFEALEPFFKGDFKNYRKRLVEIQDALGSFQDLRMAQRRVDEVLPATEKRDFLIFYGQLKQLFMLKQKEEENKFLKLFREFEKMKTPRIKERGRK